MSYRLIGLLRAETSKPDHSPSLKLLLELLGEGYTIREMCGICGMCVSTVTKWTRSDPATRVRPNSRNDKYSAVLLSRWYEHVAARTDTFPLHPEDLKTLLLL